MSDLRLWDVSLGHEVAPTLDKDNAVPGGVSCNS